VAASLTALDSIDGGAGVDTLKIVEAAAIDTTAITGLKIANVEKIEITSGSTVVADSSAWTGATTLTIASGDDVTATAAATTDVVVNASALSAAAGNELVVNGGKSITTTSADTLTLGAGTTSSDIAIGGTTAAAGAVKVTHTETVSDAGVAGASTGASSTVTVTGGTTVEVNSLATVGAAEDAGDILTIGAVSVTGNASTTAVTVNQSAATAAYNGTTQKNISIANGAVTIADGNAATASDTIKTVTLANFGATSITSTVLDTLNVTGGASAALASGAITLDASAADTSVKATTLALNLAGGFVGAVSGTQADNYTTVNVASSAASTVADATFAAATTLNVSGAGVTTFTGFTGNAALTAINSTGAGLTIGAELATGVAVTGGAGVETISVGATTKAINLGAGNDVVTISSETLGAGGSVVGGEGTDTIVANTNTSNIAGLPQFAGFEVLRVAGAAAQGAHNANGFTALEVGAINAAGASFTNVAAGVGLTQLATMGGNLAVTLANATGTNDTFNLTMKSAGAIGNAGETITIAGVENINIKLEDTDTTAHVNTVELVAGAAKAITVTGNAGLVVANAPASVTSFDASGVVLGKVTDTGVTYTSTNTTVAEAVTIKGSNGVDILSGSGTANDTITGGAGADTLIYTGGADSLTGGSEADTFDINATGTKTAFATITDLTKGDKIDFADLLGTPADLDVAAGAGGMGAAKVSLGAAATFDQLLDAAAAGDGSGTEIFKWFNFGTDTYAVIDNTAGATFAATDTVVKITGVVDLTASAVVDGVLTLA
jgi:S-layer protein